METTNMISLEEVKQQLQQSDVDALLSAEDQVPLTEDQKEKAKLFLLEILDTCYQIQLSEEDQQEMDRIQVHGDIKIFLGCCLSKYTNDTLDQLLNKIDIMNQIKGPMDVNRENVAEFLTWERDDKLLHQIQSVLREVKQDLQDSQIDQYVRLRNKRNEDGTLDTFITPEELQRCMNGASDVMVKNKRISGIQHIGENLTQFQNTMKDQVIGSRYIYESAKQIYCNDLGYTPESVDAFFQAMIQTTQSKLDDEGISYRRELQNMNFQKENMAKHWHLLVRPEDWKPGQIQYISEIVKRVDEIEEEQKRRFLGKSREADEFYKSAQMDIERRNKTMELCEKNLVSKYRERRVRDARTRRAPIKPSIVLTKKPEEPKKPASSEQEVVRTSKKRLASFLK